MFSMNPPVTFLRWRISSCHWSCSLPSAAACTKFARTDLTRKRDKVDRLYVIREGDATETLWRLHWDISHLQWQTFLEESFGALQTIQTGVFWSGSRWIRRNPCCFHPVQRRNLQLSCCGVPGGHEDQNTASRATKLFGPGLVDFPFPASFFTTAHFPRLLSDFVTCSAACLWLIDNGSSTPWQGLR